MFGSPFLYCFTKEKVMKKVTFLKVISQGIFNFASYLKKVTNCFVDKCTLADSGFLKNFLYQSGVKSTVSWVFEDLKFKISEG